MDFNDPVFGGDGDPTASYCPDEEDESPPHSTPLPSSPQHLPESQRSSKRARQASLESGNKDDIMCDTNTQLNFSRLPPSTHMDEVCSALKALHHLDDEHDKIAHKASTCPTPERHANVMYALLAAQQHQTSVEASVPYGDTFKVRLISLHLLTSPFRFILTSINLANKTFVRTNARMSFLIPTLEAYSNNPNKSGALPKSLYYLSLDAIHKQPDEWREDNLPPKQLKGESPALKLYAQVIDPEQHPRDQKDRDYRSRPKSTCVGHNGEGLSRLPLASEMKANSGFVIYSDLPPENRKWTEEQIRTRVESNWLMRIRVAYLRLVLVYYYTHPSSKGTQWGAIDDRLAILRNSTSEFQTMHATLVLKKDKELFSHSKHYKKIPTEQFTVPSVDDVNIALSQKESTQEFRASQAPDLTLT
ncbi:uncharacterized protein PGTG_15909 [Puccinia graminis f. sp. tritici CRL 75-36-700-3]|uniref:Uncharacterized protein n=1 Tax=Puccinia graminis f. sp. tritici (strain CRL 75-36-700-3 / race SCCL) TaxID=418459 RepID=E3L0G3_PUCGT|nr:uncharacterized protein PGTG_15909 [Puccinia graminis f. sp. tritici CRL 75-36-700-3]EFP90061.2 hypothetical protein PGTG_15909 [Puccinia graminis f. sp. tritici CRL 75-36-700-3]